jgi:hypothetical protein
MDESQLLASGAATVEGVKGKGGNVVIPVSFSALDCLFPTWIRAACTGVTKQCRGKKEKGQKLATKYVVWLWAALQLSTVVSSCLPAVLQD